MSSTSTQSLTNRNSTSTSISEIHERYGTKPKKLLEIFNPGKQIVFSKDVERSHFGAAPTLRMVAQAYGEKIPLMWLRIQLGDLMEYVGCKNKLTTAQLDNLIAIIMHGFDGYKLTEFMLFFLRFKMARYGRFYGGVDPMIIIEALEKFDCERRRAWIEHEKKEEERRKIRAQYEAAALRERYTRRVASYPAEEPPLTLLQYRLMGYDRMSDEELTAELEALASGSKRLPHDVTDILSFLAQ